MSLLSTPAGWQTCGITMFASLRNRPIFLMTRQLVWGYYCWRRQRWCHVYGIFAVFPCVRDVSVPTIGPMWGVISLFHY